MQIVSHAVAEAFFLDTVDGKRFCVFYPVDQQTPCYGAVLFAPPFGEEMNKSRRMLAQLARVLARQGFAVLSIDLYGCGDSDGEFRDASWDTWKEDISLAYSWLQHRCNAPISLFGLRLGALLALDFMRNSSLPIHQLIMWQPVFHGQQFLTQFYRLQIANDMLNKKTATTGGTQAIRQLLAKGEVVEIAGYEITSKLSNPIDALDSSFFLPNKIPVYWFEMSNDATMDLSPAKHKIFNFWKQHQVDIRLQQLAGPEFWATQEVTVDEGLIAATASLFTHSSQ